MLRRPILSIVLMIAACSVSADPGQTVKEIKERGYLKCGVSTGLPGFSYIDSNGKWQGFDVDFCRAIASGILHDPNKVEFMPLDSKSRFAALSAKEIDVLVRNTTWNFTREASLNVLFPAVTFFDGQSVLVRKETKVKAIEELENATICVIQGTTSEINLTSFFYKKRVKFKPIYFDRSEQMIRSYEAGRCDAMSSDRSQLFVLQSILSKPSEHIVLDEVISKEPLSPVVRDDDPDFFKLIRWVVFSIIQAEEWGLNHDNFLKTSRQNPDIQKFLGMSNNVAESIGLEKNFVSQILVGVGNYGQIFDKNLGSDSSIGMQRDQNALWSQGSGLMYAMPSR